MLLRKLFRTAWKYKAQFISMIIMVAIGIGVFIGFNMEWYSLQKDTSSFFEQTAFADYRIYNDAGFTAEDASAIEELDGVDAVARVLNVNVGVKDTAKSLGLFVAENDTVSTMVITEGAEYSLDSEDFWLSDKFAAANGIGLGDTLTVVYRNFEISGVVAGLAKSSEFMICVADENQLMPDYNSYGFVYASPKKISSALNGLMIYPQINILSSLDKTEMESKIAAALGKTTLVLSKDENYSYAGAQGEIEEGQSMGAILPVLFLLIGVLTMITTMHRITANEKTQIGTLKALGFKNGKILRHYTSYGLVIGLIGALLGVALGFGIAYLVVSPTGMQSTYMDMPVWNLYIPWFCWLVLVAAVAFLTLISFLSVRSMLRGSAADALRPYTPKKVKPMKIERTKVWNKLSFGSRWNLRDIVRHKSRSLMTLVGVIGCMILLVGGLGMRDTMNAYIDVIDNKIFNYETRVNIVETADNAQVLSFAEQYGGDLLASSSVSLNGEAVTLDIYNVTHDKIRFLDKNNKTIALQDSGVYLCIRLTDGISVGDQIDISPYGSDKTYTVTVAGVMRSVLTESITLTEEYARTIGIPYTYSAVFVDSSPSEISSEEFISGTQTKENLLDSYDSFMEIMNTMVIILIVAAIVLGIVVLYNLGVMSYVERYRELATLKVVGFRNKHIGRILISQNIWLTLLGVVIGLPAGVGVLQLLIITLASEYELKMVLGAATYCISVLLTFIVSLAVGFFVARKNKKVNMVEALKGAE